MSFDRPGRRDFLKSLGAVGIAGLPPAVGSWPTRLAGASVAPAYDPGATFPVRVQEVDVRRNAAGRMLRARIYQPDGPGPFPTVLDLHGGAWNAKNRFAEEPMDRALAASGLLVVAIDLTLAPEAPYPASVQDANYGVRWLKWKAPTWNGDGRAIGIYGSSSGGHVAELLIMRPRDRRYNAIPLLEAPDLDATVAYVATRSPISDPYARFQNAERHKRTEMMANHTAYFKPWDTILEANPQLILERRESVSLGPLLIMQGGLDDNVLPAVQETFAKTYRDAGGECEYRLFEGAEHQWVAEEGPKTDEARRLVKAFIARQLARAGRSAALGTRAPSATPAASTAGTRHPGDSRRRASWD